MQFAIETDYVIRILFFLEPFPPTRREEEIAKQMGIPAAVANDLLLGLCDAGWVTTTGTDPREYAIAVPLDSITLLDVLNHTEGPLNLNRCLKEPLNCQSFAIKLCPVRNLYICVEKSIEIIFMHISLADILDGTIERRISELLLNTKSYQRSAR